MGLLNFFDGNYIMRSQKEDKIRFMKFKKGDKIHPVLFGESPVSSFRTSNTVSGTLSKSESGKKEQEAPMGWDKSGGYPNLPLPPPATYGRPRRKSSSCSLCYFLSFLCSFLVILLILAGLAVFIFFVIFQPKLPKYSMQNVAITEMNVTSRDGGAVSKLDALQNPVLNANIAFTILAQNPNQKLGIHYKNVSLFVSYQGTTFAHSFLAPFYQKKNSTSEVVANIKATNTPLSASQGQELQIAINNNDVPLFARINVRGALQIGSWITPSMWIHVVCNVRASPPTAPHGAQLLSKSCKWVR